MTTTLVEQLVSAAETIKGICRNGSMPNETDIIAIERAALRLDQLEQAVEIIHSSVRNIMPLHNSLDELMPVIIKTNNAAWTRLFAVYKVANAVVRKE